jgi:molybdopterin-synthase adenylyltransferase
MSLQDDILKSAQSCVLPDKTPCSIITLSQRDSLAQTSGCSKRTVEIAALDAGVIPERYLRNIGALQLAGQKKLLESTVLVLGAGGLGGTVAQLLARMGVGTLIVADGDSFSESNLNRQAFSFEGNLGREKVLAVRDEIGKINAATEVRTVAGYLGKAELGPLLNGVDAAIDALDNMPSRFVLEEACREKRIPLVHGAVAGFSGQVMTIFPEDAGLRAIYGEPGSVPEKGIELQLGNLAGIVSAIASLQVQEAVKILTGLGRPLRERLLLLDSLSGSAEIISLK